MIDLGKSVQVMQVAGLHLSPLVQTWAALAREEEKKRLDQRARKQADPDGHYATTLNPWVIAAVSSAGEHNDPDN